MKRAAAEKGPEWLQSQVGDLITDAAGGSTPGEVSHRTRRSRPLARFSPGPAPRPVRLPRSPVVDRSVPLAKRQRREVAGVPGRSTRRRPVSGGGATGRDGAGSPPVDRGSSGRAPPPPQNSGQTRGTRGMVRRAGAVQERPGWTEDSGGGGAYRHSVQQDRTAKTNSYLQARSPSGQVIDACLRVWDFRTLARKLPGQVSDACLQGAKFSGVKRAPPF